MAPLSGTRRAAEPILPHARSPVTPGTFATRFRWSRSVVHRAPQSLFTARTDARHSGDVCDQVPMARSRSSNHGAELTYGDEFFFFFFAFVSELFVKIRFLCGKSDFLGLSVWFFVSRGWHLWIWHGGEGWGEKSFLSHCFCPLDASEGVWPGRRDGKRIAFYHTVFLSTRCVWGVWCGGRGGEKRALYHTVFLSTRCLWGVWSGGRDGEKRAFYHTVFFLSIRCVWGVWSGGSRQY